MPVLDGGDTGLAALFGFKFQRGVTNEFDFKMRDPEMKKEARGASCWGYCATALALRERSCCIQSGFSWGNSLVMKRLWSYSLRCNFGFTNYACTATGLMVCYPFCWRKQTNSCSWQRKDFHHATHAALPPAASAWQVQQQRQGSGQRISWERNSSLTITWPPTRGK